MRPRLLLAGGLALVAVVVAAAAFAFLWPRESRSFDLGPLDQFAPGTVTTYNLRGGVPVLSPDGRVHTNEAFHVVRFKDGEIRALSSKDPHLGCAVPWRPDFEWDGETGFFRNPCHGETFDMAGNRVFGPSPRGLDRFGVEIENGRVVVDLDDVTRGSRPSLASATDATPAATATPQATAPAATVRPVRLEPGESLRLSVEPFSAARMSEVRERLADEQLDDERSTLFYDREQDRLYLLEDVYRLCFLADGIDGRPAGLATSGPDGTGELRTLIVRFEPFEVVALDARLNPGCHPAPIATAGPGRVAMSIGLSQVTGDTRLPRGRYSFDPATLELTLLYVTPPYDPDALLDRWTNTPNGAPLELVREDGAVSLIDTAGPRVLLEGVGTYAVSPDGRLLAVNGRRTDSEVARLHVVVISNLFMIAVGRSPAGSFRWSPDSRWLAASWSDPVVDNLPSAYVIEFVDGGGFGFESRTAIGPLDGRWAVDWLGPETLLLRTVSGGPDRRYETVELPGGATREVARTPSLLGSQLSPDHRVIATSAWGESFALYEFDGGTRFVPPDLAGVDLGILDYSWSPDGRWLAAWRAPGRS
jgi:nitrite reductase/ring-hydroxylating ferredoxin subunit